MAFRKAVFLLVTIACSQTFGVVSRAEQPAPQPLPGVGQRDAPLRAGANSISNVVVKKQGGLWAADFDYVYSGDPRTASLGLTLTPQSGTPAGPSGHEQYQTDLAQPQIGSHHVHAEIRYPGETRTLTVAVTMRREMFSPVVLAEQRVEQVIDWPDFQTWMRDQRMARTSPDENLDRAVRLIDNEGEAQLAEARTILEKLIADDPKLDPAYVELARVAMKSNWGTQGLHQAETLLSSALQIRPDSVNAKILLGYVYTNQNRFDKAEALFTDAAKSTTNNLWLWTNWGDLLKKEGKPEQAMVKYRQAVSHPVTHDTYDRARVNAYRELLALLEQRRQFDQMEPLYKQRVAEYGPGACYSDDYTRFLLEVRGDAQRAIDLAKQALNQNCDDTESRELLGLSDYVKWASTSGEIRNAALNEARIYLPAGPKALYLLAKNERTAAAARALIGAGEDVDQTDNERINALAYALQNRDAAAAERLLKLGARPDTLVSDAAIPVALIPVLDRDADCIRALRQAGVNYSTLRFRGATAFDIAKRLGDPAIIEALGGRNSAL